MALIWRNDKTDPLAALEEAVRIVRPALVVIDTLSRLGDGRVDKASSSSAWNPIMSRLARIAHEFDVALLNRFHPFRRTLLRSIPVSPSLLLRDLLHRAVLTVGDDLNRAGKPRLGRLDIAALLEVLLGLDLVDL